jgi:hypothetical protein
MTTDPGELRLLMSLRLCTAPVARFNRASWIDRGAMPRLPVAFHFPAVA